MRIPTIHKGFTLIELAMVLFILALVLGGLMSPLSTRLEQANREETKELLKQAKESLIGYALVHGHLPCPDCPDGSDGCGAIEASDSDYIGDGIEDGVDGSGACINRTFPTCAVDVGYLPFATLGIPGRDPWDRRFIYSVSPVFSDDTDGLICGDPAVDVSFEISTVGSRDIRDTANNIVADEVPALVYSLGKNGQDIGGTAPVSTFELENWWTSGNSVFISDSYSQSAGSEYDDIFIWISSPELMYRMVTAERLP